MGSGLGLQMHERVAGSKIGTFRVVSLLCQLVSCISKVAYQYSWKTCATGVSASSFSDLADPIIVDGKPQLIFAGEAVHRAFYGTVHGAICSGRLAADAMHRFKLD